jgi:hypothetical protein
VEVLVTRDPAWESFASWSVEPTPSLRFGLIEGDAPYLFQDIRGVVLLEDGRIMVADGLTRELRFFDANGEHLLTVGGLGQGPGEFGGIDWVRLCGGALFAFDRRQRRVNVFGLAGEFMETFPLLEPQRERVPYESACGPDGKFVVVGWGQGMPDSSARFGLYQARAPIWLIDPIADVVTELGEYVSSERVFHRNTDTGGGGSEPHPFGRSVSFALARDRVFIGTSERLQVEVRGHDGTLLRVLRGPNDDLGITPAMIAEYRALELSRPDSLLRNRLEGNEMLMPSTLPAYTQLLLDPGGNLWVERFRLPGQGRQRWGVFAETGEFLGHLEMPDGFELMDLASDHIIGVSEDELGVERVETYRLHRN